MSLAPWKSVSTFAPCLLALVIAGCQPDRTTDLSGTDAITASDAEAVQIAQSTMRAMGGRESWNDTRYFRWTFFGNSRTHYWDKATGRARVEMHARGDEPDTIVLFNVDTKQGDAWVGDELVTDEDQREQLLRSAYGAWVNDGYWLFMPYKLLDPGVTLRHLGGTRMDGGRLADRLELTFDAVGLTPQNKYHVDVARDTGLVAQWSFFPTVDTAEPRFTMPWENWQWYGPIMLSDGRGGERGLSNVAVYRSLSDSVFESPAPVGDDAGKPY